jgi:N-methylhydantoinase A
MHAAGVCAELEISTILCPRASGVLSALGLIAAGRRRDSARTLLLSGDEISAERLAAEVADLAGRAGAGLEGAELEVLYDLRYSGQSFELPIPGPPDPDPADLAEAFAREHEVRYGYRDPDAELELVGVRVAAVVPGPALRPRAASGAQPDEGSRRARFGGEWVEARVLRGEPAAGSRATGPCVFELPEATLVLPPGWEAEVDRAGTIEARRPGTDAGGSAS